MFDGWGVAVRGACDRELRLDAHITADCERADGRRRSHARIHLGLFGCFLPVAAQVPHRVGPGEAVRP